VDSTDEFSVWGSTSGPKQEMPSRNPRWMLRGAKLNGREWLGKAGPQEERSIKGTPKHEGAASGAAASKSGKKGQRPSRDTRKKRRRQK